MHGAWGTTQTPTANDSTKECLLGDYDIRHSSFFESPVAQGDLVIVAGGIQREGQPANFDASLAPHPTVSYPVTNPDWWPKMFRKTPDYRPINRELDMDERLQKPLFRVVGGIMVCGCSLISGWAAFWRGTLGRLTDIGKSKIGGEW